MFIFISVDFRDLQPFQKKILPLPSKTKKEMKEWLASFDKKKEPEPITPEQLEQYLRDIEWKLRHMIKRLIETITVVVQKLDDRRRDEMFHNIKMEEIAKALVPIAIEWVKKNRDPGEREVYISEVLKISAVSPLSKIAIDLFRDVFHQDYYIIERRAGVKDDLDCFYYSYCIAQDKDRKRQYEFAFSVGVRKKQEGNFVCLCVCNNGPSCYFDHLTQKWECGHLIQEWKLEQFFPEVVPEIKEIELSDIERALALAQELEKKEKKVDVEEQNPEIKKEEKKEEKVEVVAEVAKEKVENIEAKEQNPEIKKEEKKEERV